MNGFEGLVVSGCAVEVEKCEAGGDEAVEVRNGMLATSRIYMLLARLHRPNETTEQSSALISAPMHNSPTGVTATQFSSGDTVALAKRADGARQLAPIESNNRCDAQVWPVRERRAHGIGDDAGLTTTEQ